MNCVFKDVVINERAKTRLIISVNLLRNYHVLHVIGVFL